MKKVLTTFIVGIFLTMMLSFIFVDGVNMNQYGIFISFYDGSGYWLEF